MSYHLKINEKNNGGWLRVIREASALVPSGLASDGAGYFQVFKGSPHYTVLNLPNPTINKINCVVKRWRLGDDPAALGRKYQWYVDFEILYVDNVTGIETRIAPPIKLTGKWYGDTLELPFEINSLLSIQDNYTANNIAYNLWLAANRP